MKIGKSIKIPLKTVSQQASKRLYKQWAEMHSKIIVNVSN